jgi:hypothetical protein
MTMVVLIGPFMLSNHGIIFLVVTLVSGIDWYPWSPERLSDKLCSPSYTCPLCIQCSDLCLVSSQVPSLTLTLSSSLPPSHRYHLPLHQQPCSDLVSNMSTQLLQFPLHELNNCQSPGGATQAVLPRTFRRDFEIS